MIKIWIDDVRPAPDGYLWRRSVNSAKNTVYMLYKLGVDFMLDIDHDAGDYASDGGDYIKLLDWLEENGINVQIHIHSMNPVGVQNMRAIIQANGWKEI